MFLHNVATTTTTLKSTTLLLKEFLDGPKQLGGESLNLPTIGGETNGDFSPVAGMFKNSQV